MPTRRCHAPRSTGSPISNYSQWTICGEQRSTLLNELGFNSDWIEKCLAHEDGGSSCGVYNKAEYEVQRWQMMQEWSNIIDAWVEGRTYVSVLIPPSMPLL
jgi:hypothetical protein